MTAFTDAFLGRVQANLWSNVNSVPGSLSTAYATFINVTNIAAGGTPAGKIVQFVRNVEAAAVSAASGATNANWGGAVNAAVGLTAAGYVLAPQEAANFFTAAGYEPD
jgi:hypothetical protein